MVVNEQDPIGKFKRLCLDAWMRGWHEANGGNLSYRLDAAERDALAALLSGDGAWHELSRPYPALGGSFIVMTASGAYLNRVVDDTLHAMGIIELDQQGLAWRVAWGFADGAAPTSELETHLATFEAGLEVRDGGSRVVYHAHPRHIIAASTVLVPRARTWTRALWQCMTECIIVFPQGIGALAWMIPGSPELARETCAAMHTFAACIWMHHGIVVRAASLDKAFGMVDTIEKACAIYLEACAASGGAEPRYLVDDEQLRAICARYGIEPNEDFLE